MARVLPWRAVSGTWKRPVSIVRVPPPPPPPPPETTVGKFDESVFDSPDARFS